VFSFTKTSVHQREIIEIVIGNSWHYIRGLLTLGKVDNPQVPPPEVLRNILVELGPFYIE
jgi:hypothetical protein